jgi:pyrroline-5-carboxylate reductase
LYAEAGLAFGAWLATLGACAPNESRFDMQDLHDFKPRLVQRHFSQRLYTRWMDSAFHFQRIAFIGGGNMASAIVGGLIRSGQSADSILVVEPVVEQAQSLREQFGVQVVAPGAKQLAEAATVVWAVKPQLFLAAAEPAAPWVGAALQVSVMAGVRSEAIARATRCPRVVRSMPNTPALIGEGISALFAMPRVTLDERMQVEQLLAPTGTTLWVEREEQLDAVTALSGSGPAYMFYVLEAMIQAGVALGLSPEQARELAQQTMAGSAALAARSDESPEVLRQRVTSKGGTTHAAMGVLEARGVKQSFVVAIQAAARRARELGDEIGRG